MRQFAKYIVLFALLPGPAFSHALDDRLACEETAHDFVENLAETGSIETPAMRVEQDSVNAFRPAKAANLTAFGLRVHAVFGYQPDDPFFKTSGSKPPSGPLYGVVVLGSTETVKRRLSDAGSSAVVHPVIPLVLTAIVCEAQSTEGVIN